MSEDFCIEKKSKSGAPGTSALKNGCESPSLLILVPTLSLSYLLTSSVLADRRLKLRNGCPERHSGR